MNALTFATVALFALVACKNQRPEVDGVSENLEIESTKIEPDGHFRAALDAFTIKDYAKSSDLIRMAIDELTEIGDRVDSIDRVNINNSIAELSDLQAAVYNKDVEDIGDLLECFVRADKAIAGVHVVITEKSYYKLDGKKAGEELLMAIQQIENLEGEYRAGIDQGDLKYLEGLKEFALELSTGQVEQPELEQHLKELSDRMLKSDLDIRIRHESARDKKPELAPGKN